jgi:5-methylcytosine-specific restriction protein B
MDYELEILSLKKRIEELEKLILKTPTQTSTENTSNRDKTKYMFEGKVFPKNRLVLAIIKKYVQQNNPSYNQLCEVFDKSLQGSLGVVELYDNAIKTSDAKKRYFLNDADILTLNNIKVVVCTQWGIFNIVKFVKRAQSLGFNIETI